MPNQHYIPAAFIAGFSDDVRTQPPRERVVTVMRSGRTFVTKAGRVAYRSNLYTLKNPNSIFVSKAGTDPNIVDHSWKRGESGLPQAIAEVATSDTQGLKAQTWLNVVVPFVAQLFVRGPEFEHRYRERLARTFGDRDDVPIPTIPDHINAIRLMEWVRIEYGLLLAEWTVLHNRSDHPYITNDVGYFPIKWNEDATGPSFFVPLRTDVAVLITPAGTPSVLELSGEQWMVATSEHLHATDPAGVIPLNGCIVASCNNEVYGPRAEVLTTASANVPTPQTISLEPYSLAIASPAESQSRVVRVSDLIRSEPTRSGIQLFDLAVWRNA